MGFDPSALPPHLLKLMSEEDRKSLGKSGQTPEETNDKQDEKLEKELQNQIASYLNMRGIEVIRSRMDRKTTNNKGVADLLFAIDANYLTAGAAPKTIAVAMEVKRPGKELSDDQVKMREWMTHSPNAWVWKTVTSLDEVKAFLGQFDL